jgi:hypothetical protein
LPADVPVGPAEIVLVVSSSDRSNGRTLGDFKNSEFFGMWRDRSDIIDSVQLARELRSEGWLMRPSLHEPMSYRRSIGWPPGSVFLIT